MNILAEEQKKLYEKGITEEELKKREEAFLKLYYKLRKKDEEKIWNRLSLKQRQKIHWIILNIYRIKNRLGGFNYELINNEREKTDRPIIFAVTHVGKFDIDAKVIGGGLSGQAGAIRLGIARALLIANPDFRKTLKSQKLLTRDSRVKERKKYGLYGARRSPQFTKR